jgi:hypothetical protein
VPITVVNVFFGLSSVDFVVLAADEQGCEAKELEILSGDSGAMKDQDKVDELDTDLECLGFYAKLGPDSSQPSD